MIKCIFCNKVQDFSRSSDTKIYIDCDGCGSYSMPETGYALFSQSDAENSKIRKYVKKESNEDNRIHLSHEKINEILSL